MISFDIFKFCPDISDSVCSAIPWVDPATFQFVLIWKLDHVLGGCIVKMVHVVKVVNIVDSLYSTPQSQTRLWSSGVWELLSTSTVKSFKAEKNSTAQYSFRTSDRSGGTLCMLSLAGQPLQERGWPTRLVRAIYSAGLSIYIHGITSA